MHLLDEDEERWYCYKDDEAYFAKDQHWAEYKAPPKQVDSSIVPNDITLRDLSSDLTSVASFEGLAGVHTRSNWKKLWTDWAKTDFWRDWGISDGSPGVINYDWAPASIFTTERKIAVRTRINVTRTTTQLLLVQTKSGAVVVYGADFGLAHESEVVLEPMGNSGAKVVVIRPLFEERYRRYDEIRILTRDAASWVSAHKKERSGGKDSAWVSGRFLSGDEFASLKLVVARLADSIPNRHLIT